MFSFLLSKPNREILPISTSGFSWKRHQGLNPLALKFARNEIFARHGYLFKSRELRDHFGALSWYRPISHNVTLSDIGQTWLSSGTRSEPGLAARLVSTAPQPLTAASPTPTGDRSLETVGLATSEAAKQYLEDVKSFQKQAIRAYERLHSLKTVYSCRRQCESGLHLTGNSDFLALERYANCGCFVTYEKSQDKRAAVSG